MTSEVQTNRVHKSTLFCSAISLTGVAFIAWAIFPKEATRLNRAARGVAGATLICTGPILYLGIRLGTRLCNLDWDEVLNGEWIDDQYHSLADEIAIIRSGPDEYLGKMPGGRLVRIPRSEIENTDDGEIWTDADGKTWSLVHTP